METRLEELIALCLSGEISIEERQELNKLLNRDELKASAKAAMLRAFVENREGLPLSEGARNATLDRIYDFTGTGRVRLRRLRRTRRVWAAAASVLVLLSLSLYWVSERGYFRASTSISPLAEIGPGGNRAILSLPDGRNIELDRTQLGIVIEDGVRYDNGTPVLNLNDHAEYPWLRTSTPAGGQYAITLPDGSKVWLNAASTLNFPQSFSPSERLVQLEGEAYFEIAHRPNQPFIVESNGQRIQVLGTHFNVKAYSDEGDTRTTLVEGSVQISAALTQESLILIPGEQGVLDKRGMYKAQVNLQQVIAWKEGRFDFNGKNLPEVMRELARWYDIEVAYEGQIPDIEFWGGVYRNQNLATVLQILETNEFSYRLEGNRKIVVFSDRK